MESTNVLSEFTYLVTYSVGAKREKFLVKNHCKVPAAIMIEMGENKINAQIDRLFEINGANLSEKKFKNKLRRDSFVEIEDLNELKTYPIGLNFNENEQPRNEFTEATAIGA